MNNDSLSMVLMVALSILVLLVIVLIVVWLSLNKKEKSGKTNTKKENDNVDENENKSPTKSYSKQSIFKFMNFDKIEDNMIVQKNGKRFLMVVECQGINYDLMSGLEKNSVEQGFLQFLNTLRYTIQIYVQTRTVNLTSSIDTYRQRVNDIYYDLTEKQNRYNQKIRSGDYDPKDLEKERFDIIRQKNLYEYGVDIVTNTERMSLNKNILSKYYYIIIPYYYDESDGSSYDKGEIENIAFSELYTKAQGIINSLGVCGVKGKILDSTELMELLYTAYNRDESEALSLQRALGAGYEELYSTAPDVLDKRMKELDAKIEEEAYAKANETILNVLEENSKKKKVKTKEEQLDELIDQMAMELIEENKKSIGEDVAEEAKKRIEEDKTKEKGGEEDGKKTKTTRKRRTTKS